MRAQRLSRSLTDRVLGGVCGGLGMYIGVDPWWVRAAFAILGVFTAGTGILIYFALWLLLPPQRLAALPSGQAHVHRRAFNAETIVLIGVAVIAMGLLVLARNLGVLSGDNGDAFAPLVVIVFGLMLFAKQWRRSA